MSAIIDIDNLTKKYGDFLAVDHVSYQINEGEILGLLGHNGAGKTTTILMLAGLITPTEGTARILGHDITTKPLEARRSIGLIPENAGYYETLTARQNLRFYCELAQLPKDSGEQRIDELLYLVGLSKWSEEKLGRFSRGMTQRFGVAQSLIRDPKVLIYDEPTLGLDPEGSKVVRRLIKDLSKTRGKTVLLCTHLLHEIRDLCDRVAIMKQGKLMAIGTIPKIAADLGAPEDTAVEDMLMQFYEVA